MIERLQTPTPDALSVLQGMLTRDELYKDEFISDYNTLRSLFTVLLTSTFRRLSVKEQLLKEIEKTSDSTLKELLDFLLFIKSRELQQEQLEISLLSEPSLAEDWLTPEESEDQTAESRQSPSLPPFLQFVEEISSQIPK